MKMKKQTSLYLFPKNQLTGLSQVTINYENWSHQEQENHTCLIDPIEHSITRANANFIQTPTVDIVDERLFIAGATKFGLDIKDDDHKEWTIVKK